MPALCALIGCDGVALPPTPYCGKHGGSPAGQLQRLRDLFNFWSGEESMKIRRELFAHIDEQEDRLKSIIEAHNGLAEALDKAQRLGSQQSHTIAKLNKAVEQADRREAGKVVDHLITPAATTGSPLASPAANLRELAGKIVDDSNKRLLADHPEILAMVKGHGLRDKEVDRLAPALASWGAVDPEKYREMEDGFIALAKRFNEERGEVERLTAATAQLRSDAETESSQVERLKGLLELHERQMGLAAKYIARYYEAMRDEDVSADDADQARQMVYAIGADMKNILEGSDGT